MSVEGIAAGLDAASEKLELPALRHAHGLLEEATQTLDAATSGSHDQKLAEVFGKWQRAADEIARAFHVCRTAQRRIKVYRASLVGSGVVSPHAVPSSSNPRARDLPANRPLIHPKKFEYFFGKVRSSKHSKDRSQQNVDELRRVRIFDTPAGHETPKRHLEEVVRSDSNIIDTYSDEHGSYQIRDSLLAGPGGFLQLNTTWQETDKGLRLTTLIPKRGKNR